MLSSIKLPKYQIYVRKNHVYEDFVGFLDYHQDNYKNIGVEIEPKITSEILENSV